jgi:hypothetical protein
VNGSIRFIREKLERLNALVDFPPGGASPDEQDEGVISHCLHRPDSSLNDGDSGRYASPIDDRDIERVHDESDDSSGEFQPVFEWGAEADEKIAALGSAAGNEILQAVRSQSGSDALGHYLSFHVRGYQWGITVKLSGIATMVAHVFNDLPVDLDTKMRLAFQAILQHELFHFATDIAVSQTEMTQQKAWWWPAKQRRIDDGLIYLEQEEKMANAWMLKAFRTALPGFRALGKQEALKNFVRYQPAGYRDALAVRSDSDWKAGLYDLIFCYADDAECLDDNNSLWGYGFNWPAQFPIQPRIDWRQCPIHLEDDSKRFGIPPGWLTFFSALADIEETDDFVKQLRKLSPTVQRAWSNTRERVRYGLTSGHDFKRWSKKGADIWSLRVNDNFRVHLSRDKNDQGWSAIAIGDHKSMGHG